MIGAVAALPALVLLGPFFMLAFVNLKVVIFGEGFVADGAEKRTQSIEEVDMLMEADIILLGGMVIALGALVGFLSCVSTHVVTHRSGTSLKDWDSYYTDWETIQNGVCHSGTPLTHRDSCYDSDGGL